MSARAKAFFIKRQLWVLGVFFVCTQVASSIYIYNQFPEVGDAQHASLNESISRWIERLGASDAGTYLRVAKTYIETGSLSDFCSGCNPPQFVPFAFWGPGAPYFLSIGLKLFGMGSTHSLFYFFTLCNAISAIFLFLTALHLLKSFWGRLLAIAMIAYIPPIHGYVTLTLFSSSEFVCMMFFSIFFFALFHLMEDLNNENISLKRLLGFAALAGLSMGFILITRESNLLFSYFLIAFILAMAFVFRKYPKKNAALTALVFFLAFQSFVKPVKIWNRKRIGHSVVALSSSGAVWRYGLWSKHDAVDWYITTGIGFGHYLDPSAAERVEMAYKEGNGNPRLSLLELIGAISKRPVDALLFKAKRIPVLWLATGLWPDLSWTWLSSWNFIHYLLLAVFTLVAFRTKGGVDPTFYLYGAFLFLASFLIHSEYRYTLPVWSSLVFIPACLIEDIFWNPSRQNCRRNRS